MAQNVQSKILVLENNTFLHEYLSEFLKIHDCQITFARDTPSLLANAHGQDFDLVYVNAADLGSNVASFIQSLKGTDKKFKVLLVNLPDTVMELVKTAGIDVFLKSPVRAEDIAKNIKELINIRAHAANEESLRLLIVDDEEELCNFLAEQFDDENFETYRAYNGKGALDLAAKYKCNMAIVDLKLPQIRGEELVELWKRNESTIKEVVLITGGIDESIMNLKRKGFTVFQKPIEMDDLIKLVLDLCRKNNLKAKKEAGK
jgi:DNA-binding NtrC family response regulator